MKLLAVLTLYIFHLSDLEILAQNVNLDPSSVVVVNQHNSLTFSCSYIGPGSASAVGWWLNEGEIVTLLVSDCTVYSGSLNTSLYEADCNSSFTWKILNVTQNQNKDEWKCKVFVGTYYDSSVARISVQVCPFLSIHGGYPNSTDRSPGSVVSISCSSDNSTNDGVFTCQADGTWNPTVRTDLCGTTTTNTPQATFTASSTAGATAMRSTATTPKTATTTTMTTLPTTSSLDTNTPTVTTCTTGSTAIRTATQQINIRTTTHTTKTTPATTRTADSDKGLVTMIIVVSVIGGILVIAIIFMLFLLSHWKNCLVQKGHRKHVHNSSYSYVGHRTQQKKYMHSTTTGRSEHSSFQAHPKSGDYSFCRGVKNPVFVKTSDSPFNQDVCNRNISEIIHTHQYSEHPPGYCKASNWEEMW